MTLDERIRSALDDASSELRRQPADMHEIVKRASRKKRLRRVAYTTTAVVAVVGMALLASTVGGTPDPAHLAELPGSEEILADGVVTEEELEAAGSTVVACLSSQGIEAEFGADEGSFAVLSRDSEALFACMAEHDWHAIWNVWIAEEFDPATAFHFYRSVVECTEARTGQDFGRMTQNRGGFASTESERTINRALAEASDAYDRCFDEVQIGEASPLLSRVVELVLAGFDGDVHFTIGFNEEGTLCAEAGSRFRVQDACGGNDLTVVIAKSDTHVAVAGYVPTAAARELNVIFDGSIRRPLVLDRIMGGDTYAFGTTEAVSPDFVEIEVVDDSGQVIERFFPSIASADG